MLHRSAKTIVISAGLILSLVTSGANAAPTFIGPLPYLSSADSPFIGVTGQPFTPSDLGKTFFLETFESGSLPRGVTAIAPPTGTWSAVCTTTDSPCGVADSVDADDGVIDGDGSRGYSYHVSATGDATVIFTFDSKVLGFTPTHVGVVWTDGYPTPITFEAFSTRGNSLGSISATVTPSPNGGTQEDRFFGVIDMHGISSIKLTSADGGGIEADHLQWGVSPIPEPSTLLLLGSGLASLGAVAWRRHPRK